MSENVIWVDENDYVLGEVSREKAHTEGLWHRVAVVYLLNADGKILIQERKDSPGFGFDHSSAGHVDPGESYLEAAGRELKEELGVSGVELKEIGDAEGDEPKPHLKKRLRHKFKIFECVAEPGRLEPTEVVRVFWADPQKIWQAMKDSSTAHKYCGGFKATLAVWLQAKGKL